MINLQKVVKEELGSESFKSELILKKTVVPPELSFDDLALRLKLQQELIDERQGAFELSTPPKTLEIFATTRAGKSILRAGILMQTLPGKQSPVLFDFHKEGKTSTFSNCVAWMSDRSNYFDISKQNHNLFETPDLRKFSPKCRKRN